MAALRAVSILDRLARPGHGTKRPAVVERGVGEDCNFVPVPDEPSGQHVDDPLDPTVVNRRHRQLGIDGQRDAERAFSLAAAVQQREL